MLYRLLDHSFRNMVHATSHAASACVRRNVMCYTRPTHVP